MENLAPETTLMQAALARYVAITRAGLLCIGQLETMVGSKNIGSRSLRNNQTGRGPAFCQSHDWQRAVSAKVANEHNQATETGQKFSGT
jgi:hypothetical protein